MENHVYKILEIVGSSEKSIEEAISTAIAQASKTVRNMDWFEVIQTRGHIVNGKIDHITKLQSRLGSLWKANTSVAEKTG
jgi:dodecin